MLGLEFLLFFSLAPIKIQDLSMPELHRELRAAEHSLHKQQKKVTLLKEAIARKEIAQIVSDLQKIQKGVGESIAGIKNKSIFAEQREILAQIIENVPQCASQAQEALDQILHLITHLADTNQS